MNQSPNTEINDNKVENLHEAPSKVEGIGTDSSNILKKDLKNEIKNNKNQQIEISGRLKITNIIKFTKSAYYHYLIQNSKNSTEINNTISKLNGYFDIAQHLVHSVYDLQMPNAFLKYPSFLLNAVVLEQYIDKEFNRTQYLPQSVQTYISNTKTTFLNVINSTSPATAIYIQEAAEFSPYIPHVFSIIHNLVVYRSIGMKGFLPTVVGIAKTVVDCFDIQSPFLKTISHTIELLLGLSVLLKTGHILGIMMVGTSVLEAYNEVAFSQKYSLDSHTFDSFINNNATHITSTHYLPTLGLSYGACFLYRNHTENGCDMITSQISENVNKISGTVFNTYLNVLHIGCATFTFVQEIINGNLTHTSKQLDLTYCHDYVKSFEEPQKEIIQLSLVQYEMEQEMIPAKPNAVQEDL